MNSLVVGALGWILVIVLSAFAAQRAIAFTAWQWRGRHIGQLALNWVAAALGGIVLSWVTWPWGLVLVAVWVNVFFRAPHNRAPDQTGWKSRKAWTEVNRQAWLHLGLLAGSAIFILPFLWLVSTSLKYDDQMKAFPPQFLPAKAVTVTVNGVDQKVYRVRTGLRDQRVYVAQRLPNGLARVVPAAAGASGKSFVVKQVDLHEVRYFRPRWENYKDALDFLPPEYLHGLVPLWNTLYITGLSILGLLLSSSLAAYAFARLRWPGRDVFFVILLATMMLPAAVTMLPVFLIFRWLGWIDTLRPLWVPAFLASPFNVFLLRQFFMTIPMELEEAAKIDGCSPLTTYWRIMLPLVKPALAAVTIMAFMGSWNNFMGPLIYINSPQKMPLSYALYLFQGMHGGEQGLMMAASTLVMLPVLLVFFFTQRYFIQGITLTGLKG